jgi:hypothetical protein
MAFGAVPCALRLISGMRHATRQPTSLDHLMVARGENERHIAAATGSPKGRFAGCAPEGAALKCRLKFLFSRNIHPSVPPRQVSGASLQSPGLRLRPYQRPRAFVHYMPGLSHQIRRHHWQDGHLRQAPSVNREPTPDCRFERTRFAHCYCWKLSSPTPTHRSVVNVSNHLRPA